MRLSGEERLSEELVEVRFAEVECGRQGLELAVGEVSVVGRNVGDDSCVKREVFQFDLAKTGR